MNVDLVYLQTRPEFTIECVKSTSRNCYTETTYRITSFVKLDKDDLARLDQCGLLGFGQAYHLQNEGTLVDSVPCVVRDKVTGQVLDTPPVAYNGEPITNTYDYTYHVYDVLRICDSGD